MVAMEGSNLGASVLMGDVERQCDQQRKEAGGDAHANAVPSVKGASASEVSPQTVPAEANGNGNAHEHSIETHLGGVGRLRTNRADGLKQTGEYLQS